MTSTLNARDDLIELAKELPDDARVDLTYDPGAAGNAHQFDAGGSTLAVNPAVPG